MENRSKSMKFDECITLWDHFLQYLTNVSAFGHPPAAQKSTSDDRDVLKIDECMKPFHNFLLFLTNVSAFGYLSVPWFL